MAQITRSKRKGRTTSPATVEGRKTLDRLWKGKREDLPIIGPDGSVVQTLKAVVVTPKDLGRAENWTGLRTFVYEWAKQNGHAVQVLKCDGSEFAIVQKG